ncbi:hypothetical protein SEA_ZOOMAN_177 [Microbacterium phage Zooman]|nr:hypothetical protein SEA_ZOOMAN_177 [Microbacterium phage Zooman]
MTTLDDLLEEQELLFRFIQANEDRDHVLFKISAEDMAPLHERLAKVNTLIDEMPDD